jgi:G3E family GTPase
MRQQTHVYLLTGFLGSGKTTLLNRMTRALPARLKTLVLMNEFGEIGVDGVLVERRDLAMIEINRGSIFCACVKSDFLKALVAIHQDIQPDLLIIESTGVANPKDLLRNLSLPLFAGRFVVKNSICVLDAANFTAVYDAFQSVVDQIAASNLFVLNKTDLANPDEIKRIETIVSEVVVNPIIFKTRNARIAFDWMDDIRIGSGSQPDKAEAPMGPIEAIDDAVNAAMSDPDAQDAPSDAMASFLMAWQGGSVDALRQLIMAAPTGLARAKGFLNIEGRTMLLNWSINQFQLDEIDLSAEQSGLDGRIVFILRQARETEIMTHLQAGGLLAPLSSHRPLGIMPATQSL